MDSYKDAIEQVLGEDVASSMILNRFFLLSTAQCPIINLTECKLDALRYLGGGDEAICGACKMGYEGIVPEKCPFLSGLPNNLWQNIETEKGNMRPCLLQTWR